jgi:hypothetical protein
MRWSMTVLIASVLAAGCAQSPIRPVTPLPAADGVIAPSADVPPAIAAFSGTWVGQWSAGEVIMEHTLVVERIEKTRDGFKVQILFSHGDQPHWGYDDAGYLRTDGSIGTDGTLRLRPSPNGARITYVMRRHGELAGELRLGGLTSYGTLRHPRP